MQSHWRDRPASRGGYPDEKASGPCGALLLTLVLAAPAAANQKVLNRGGVGSCSYSLLHGPVTINEDNEIWRSPWYFGANWACTKDIDYQVTGDSSLWLWYANSVDTTDPVEYMPADAAWPWIKGMAKNGGVDSFFANEGMTGRMVAAKFDNTVHLSDHYLGGTGPSDPEILSGAGWEGSGPSTSPARGSCSVKPAAGGT